VGDGGEVAGGMIVGSICRGSGVEVAIASTNVSENKGWRETCSADLQLYLYGWDRVPRTKLKPIPNTSPISTAMPKSTYVSCVWVTSLGSCDITLIPYAMLFAYQFVVFIRASRVILRNSESVPGRERGITISIADISSSAPQTISSPEVE
jgi:hypothetical protein